MTHAVGTAGNLGLPGRGPISWEEMGERTPRGKRFFPLDSLLWWSCVGEAVPLTGYLACGPPSERPVAAAHRLGGLGTWTGTLWEKEEKNHFVSHFFLPSTNHFSRPPEPVGGP